MKRLSLILILVMSTLVFLGCSKKENRNPLDSGTGVKGLDRPDEILSNPYVEDIIYEAKQSGLNITPEKGFDPPNISGCYSLNGDVYVPIHGDLASGTWRWYNQKDNNSIDTDYDQGFQVGLSDAGEIIRGEGRKFTVYSVLNVTTGGITERLVIIVDGKQDSYGDIGAYYLCTPTQYPSYYVPSAGRLILILNGAKKQIPASSQGGFLLGHVKDILKLPN